MNIKIKHIIVCSFAVFCAISYPKYVTAQSKKDSFFSKVENFGRHLLFKDIDTSYIKSYQDKINVHLLSANKTNFFQIWDQNSYSNQFYRPDLGLTFGAGVTHNWFSFDLSFSSRIKEQSSLENNDFLDIQTRMFTTKQYIEATLQYYNGYKLTKVSSYYDEISDDFKARSDMRSIHVNLQYLFAFNYSEFSIKAPYVFNETQQKSAGSPVAGAAFTMFVFDADSSIVPSEFEADFNPELHLRDFNNVGISLNLGYMYTAVIKKKLYYNIGLIPGVDLNKGDYLTDIRQRLDPNVSFRIRFMNALGYNGPRIYIGAHFIGNVFRARFEKKATANIGYTKLGFVLGYRFK